MKQAMRDKDSQRLSSIRLLQAAIQRREVDERISLEDEHVTGIVEKLIKQSREAIVQFQKGQRADLVAKEQQDVQIWQTYLPAQLAEGDVDRIIQAAIAETGASSVKDMGKVMSIIKPKIQGKADLGKTSAKVKNLLSSS